MRLRIQSAILAAVAALSLAISQPASAKAQYSFVDLGTLGGTLANAFDINTAGQVVGYSKDASGLNHGFLWSDGHMIDLGNLGSDLGTIAYSINDNGDVVGSSAYPGSTTHAFLWSKGHMTDLGIPGTGDTSSYAPAINKFGQVVVQSCNNVAGTCHSYIWKQGAFTELGTLGGQSTYAVDINNHGQVVGTSQNGYGEMHAFLWEKGHMTDLGTLGGMRSVATAINDRGQIIGRSTDLQEQTHYVLWDNGSMTDLGQLVPGGINRRGEIVGSDLSYDSAEVFDRGTLTRLPLPDGWDLGGASAVNDKGLIVGAARNASGDYDPVLWKP